MIVSPEYAAAVQFVELLGLLSVLAFVLLAVSTFIADNIW